MKSVTVAVIAWFRPDQWQRLLEVSADRESLEATHPEWERNASKTLKKLSREGIDIRKVPIEIEELVAWCLSRVRSMANHAESLLRKSSGRAA